MNAEMQDYFIEPVDKLNVLMPRTACPASTEPNVCLVNPPDSFRTLKKGAVIGSAFEVDAFQEEDRIWSLMCLVATSNLKSLL